MMIQRFLQDRRASVAPIFAIAIIPVIGFIGAAIDYSRANAIKLAMQSALDATSLAMSKTAATLTETQLQTQTNAYFQSLFNRPDALNVTITPVYSTTGGSTLTITGSAKMETEFMRILGYEKLDIGSKSTVTWGNTRLRVALVLDNTGSMADANKIGALKTATNNLLTQLKNAAATNGDVYVSIVPFAKNVNAGASTYNSTWIDWADWEDEPPYIKTNKPSNWDQIGPGDPCPFSFSNHGFGCSTTPAGSSMTSYIPSSGTYAGYICPSVDYGNKVPQNAATYYNGCYSSVQKTNTISTGSHASCGTTTNCSCSGNGSNKVCTQSYYEHTWIKNARSTWNGCVVDRGDASGPNSGNYDTNVAAPTPGATAKQYAAEQNAYCPQAVMPLSYNWTAMTNLVNSMSPAGFTNQGLGLQLGWMSLVGGGPFPTPPAMDSSYQYQQVIILMSDGLNTQNRWYTSQSSIDARQQLTCNNAKAAGITLYTIHVNTDGDPTSTLLQQCASDANKFFLVTSATQLNGIFTQIGTNLTKLRIAK